MRINKLFSNLGICSRKETNKLIEEKRIKVNRKDCVLGQWIKDDDEILFDGELIKAMEKVYLAFYKPKGVTCTLEKSVKGNIGEYISYHQYIFPVGRLDKDSEGLIILTNDGEFSNNILECDNKHEKEYIVKVDKAFDENFISAMRNGVEIPARSGSGIKRISDTKGVVIKDGKNKIIMLNEARNGRMKKDFIKTRPCKVERINENTFKIILIQGLNRQIRKMSSVLGYKVISLKRTRIMNIHLDCLECGSYRVIPKEIIKELMKKHY